jgi:hypothetical protein
VLFLKNKPLVAVLVVKKPMPTKIENSLSGNKTEKKKMGKKWSR